ncbi:MAG: NYN domain-containing protein [Armatimonadetes bacterium]|nr:NYN domain-containing protein [Armatimonadota bacterium]
MATAVYIDGFNLYYGLAKPLGCKWVDLQQHFERQFPQDDILFIGFYEALVTGPNRANQEAYLDALQTKPKVRVVLGEMKPKRRECRVAGCDYKGPRDYPGFEEKHTDVSIAIAIVDDTHRGLYDKLIVVTGDTDIVPAIALAKKRRPEQQIVTCIPALDKERILGAKPLVDVSDRYTRVDAGLFPHCQFPTSFLDTTGVKHTRPNSWRQAPGDAVQKWISAHRDRWLTKMPRLK